jgi:hypothetical protein
VRKVLIGPMLALGLAGCVTTGTPGVPPSDLVTFVQQQAALQCGFQPTRDFVNKLFLSMGSLAGAIGPLLVSTICSAVSTRSYQRGTTLRVNGIPLDGRFVRRMP